MGSYIADKFSSIEDLSKIIDDKYAGSFLSLYYFSSICEKKDGKWMMAGNLTIKDQKKNIQFPVSYTQDGTTLKLTSEPFTIDRTHWNVNYGSKSVFDDLGDKFVNDDIELTVKVIAERQM